MSKRFHICLVTAIALAGLHVCALAKDTDVLRVLSYNIHHGEGVDGKLDLERIAKVIRSTDPDIVSLQEVDRNVLRSGNVDQPEELSRLLKMQSFFVKNIDVEQGEYGNAVLTKLPVIEHHNERLPMTDNSELRGVLVVQMSWKATTTPLTFMSTHFDHRANSADRIASAKKINDLAASLDGPIVLAGDFNANPDSEPIRILLAKWTNASPQDMPTFPVDLPSRQIDYILLRTPRTTGIVWKTLETKVIDERVASDHRPIFSIVKISKP